MRKTRRRSVSREIVQIRNSLTSIGRALQRLAPVLAAAASDGTGKAAPAGARRQPQLSAERRAALKLQGEYMGRLRNLEPKQKARVKALRTAKGIRTAIRLAKSLAKA